VAGGAAVVRDYYQQVHAHAASAALVKATLVNSAVDLLDENNDGVNDNALPIPNSYEGWGRVNLAAATDGSRQFVDEGAGLSSGGSQTFTYDVAAGTPFKVTLAWSDYRGTTSATKMLVNDLDLEVSGPGGVLYKGNVFGRGWSVTGGLRDNTNNLENVFVQSPAAGTWTVTVRAFNVPQGPQPFALVTAGQLSTAPPVTISIGDVSVAEGNSGTANAVFTVSLSGVASVPVAVDFATADGTAVAGSDYAAAAGTLTFTPGQTSKAITVLVNGDTAVEPDETFFVNLSNPSGATIADGQGVGTITNDDTTPPGPEPVAWVSAVGVSISGNSLTKTASSAWGNAGAVSSQQIASGSGYVEITASETTTYRMIGLSNGDTNASYEDIDFALYLALGQLRVYENGTSKGTFGNFATGDKLRVTVANGQVTYSRNGSVFYTSTKTAVYPLLVDCALYSQGATLSGAVIGTLSSPPPPPPPPPGEQNVAWVSAVGVSISGNSLTKTASSAWGNGGAVSSQQITSGSGYVEITASETTTYRMVGLSNGDTNASYEDIDFALYLALGQLRVYESGTSKGTFGSFATGDKLRVTVANGQVTYSRNGSVFYTSSKTAVYPLLVDCALYTQGATLSGAVIGGAGTPPPPPPPPPGEQNVAWVSAVGVSISGNSLTKTASSAWGNGGAVSSQQITSGSGYVEITASETTTYRMVGLSNGDTNASYEDIDFALYLALGQLRVYEGGTSKGTFGSFATGDKLRVTVANGQVTYSRNGSVFYTSTKTAVYPLLVDCALYTQGATLNGAVIASAP
jgi:hypothetical protein